MRLPWDKDENENITNQIKYDVKSYPDGSKYIQITKFGAKLTYRLNNYEDLWLLAQINDALLHNNLQVELFIPNLIDAQADRRFDDYQPFSLKMVCKFINDMKSFHKIKIFHPHNAEVVQALIDRVEIIDNHDFVYEVLADLKENYDFNAYDMEDGLILMSSDAGGFKPLMKLCDKLEWQGETYSASKSRKYEDGKSKLTQIVDREDFNGKDILIIDDICIYGGTFKGLSKMLKERNCGKIYLAVSHITVQNLGDDPVTNYFDKVFTTNSKYDNYFTANTEKTKVNNAYFMEGKPRNLEIIKMI